MTTLSRQNYPTDLSAFFRYAMEANMIEQAPSEEKKILDNMLLLSKVRALGHKILKDKDTQSERALVQRVLERLPSYEPLLHAFSHLFCKAIVENKNTIILFENIDDTTLAPLTLRHPCRIEFGGIYYPSAHHTFIAQMFRFRDNLQKEVAACRLEDLSFYILSHKEQIVPAFQEIKRDILRNVFHAKFGQNPSIQRSLIATLDSRIVYSFQDNFCQDSFIGKILQEEREYQGGSLCSYDETIFSEPSPSFCGKNISAICQEIEQMNECADEKMYRQNTKTFRDPKLSSLSRCSKENFPFDETLFCLENKKPINANLILQGKYIATQAPLRHAEEDFWRMILESGSKAIVMLNETTDYLCYEYYPKDIHHPRIAGKATITLLKKERLITHDSWTLSPEADTPHGYIIRELQIEIEGKITTTTHYQYLNWKDENIGYSSCVLSLIEHIVSSGKITDAPITVHCAAGIGRTAAFIVILEQVLKHKEGKEMNIPSCLKRLRSKEEGRYYKMIQSIKQHIFCYKTIHEMLY